MGIKINQVYKVKNWWLLYINKVKNNTTQITHIRKTEPYLYLETSNRKKVQEFCNKTKYLGELYPSSADNLYKEIKEKFAEEFI